jgi:hypothetical protein
MTERWHNFVTDAIWKVHLTHGFRYLDPCQVYFRLRDERCVLYKPDAILLRRRGRGYRAVVVEAETNPTAKLIPGDAHLASLVRRPFAELYPLKETGLGRSMRNERVFKDTYDRRMLRQVIYPDERNLITGDEIGTLDFLLFTEGESNREYLQSYLDLFVEGMQRHGAPFAHSRCISTGRHSRSRVERTVSHVLGSL